jgi:carboxymethylenebutenolidase
VSAVTPIPDELDVRTADGVAHAWVYRGGSGPRPGVIVYPDAFDARPSMHEIARRVARLGYHVLLPKVFYREGAYRPFDAATVFTDPPERERLMALVRSLTPDRVGSDAAAYLDALAARGDVRTDRVGVMGYCMGGRMAFVTAAKHPDRVRAAASFHPAGLVTDAPDSPHRLVPGMKASVYLGVADGDRGFTPEQQGVLAAALGAADVAYCLELYRGKKHGFAVPDHAGAHDREAEDRHWRRLEAFFGETLA